MALTITHQNTTPGPSNKVDAADWTADHTLSSGAAASGYVLTADGAGGADWAAASAGGLQTATVTLSSADILDLHDTPVTLVAAPGAGKWLNVHRAVASMTFGTVAYTIADGVAVFVGTLIPADLTNSLTAGADRIETFEGQATNFAPSAVENEALLITDAVADPTDGDGTLTVTVYYTVEDVP